MNTKVCPNCGKDNAAQMRFCSNCGQSLPENAPPPRQEEPPTVFMGQPAPKPQSPPQQSPFNQSPPSSPNNPFGQQPSANPQNNPFGQQAASNSPFNQPNTPQFSTPAPPAQPPKKSNKGLIFGAVGCLGLLVILGIGGIIGSAIYFNKDKSRVDYTPSPSPYSNTASNTGSSNTATNTSTSPSSSTLLTTILESRKAVGSFNQTDVRSVVTKDYFPEGTGAAQATYSDGSKNVFLTVGQFTSMADAKKNFNDQIRGIKGNGGKVSYENTASDGTISAIYEKGGYYFAEYCNTNNFCNRIHSNNRDALKSFFASYAQK